MFFSHCLWSKVLIYHKHICHLNLPIPTSIIASKASFDTRGHVLDPYKSSLNPQTVKALICTQNWLKSNKMLIANHCDCSATFASSTITVEEMSLYDVLESGNINNAYIYFTLFLVIYDIKLYNCNFMVEC